MAFIASSSSSCPERITTGTFGAPFSTRRNVSAPRLSGRFRSSRISAGVSVSKECRASESRCTQSTRTGGSVSTSRSRTRSASPGLSSISKTVVDCGTIVDTPPCRESPMHKLLDGFRVAAVHPASKPGGRLRSASSPCIAYRRHKSRLETRKTKCACQQDNRELSKRPRANGRSSGFGAFACHWLLTYREKKRSEEHTSELQSLRHLVCRLL